MSRWALISNDSMKDGMTRCWISRVLLLDELPHVGQEIRAVHIAVAVDGDAFGEAGASRVRIGTRVGDEGRDLAVPCAADSDAAARSGVVAVPRLRQTGLSGIGSRVSRFRVGDVERVCPFVDIEPARTAELEPLGDEGAVLIEDLEAVVLTVADEQPSPRIEGQRVHHVELAR